MHSGHSGDGLDRIVFERWFIREWSGFPITRKGGQPDAYEHDATQTAWEAWRHSWTGPLKSTGEQV